MVSSVRQLLGLALAAIGFLGSIIICALPTWTVTTFIDDLVGWSGLWKICLMQKTGQTHCEAYPPLLALSPDLQAFRALIIVAIILGFSGIILGVVGRIFIEDQGKKCKVAIAAGIIFIIAGLMVIIPVSWITNSVNQLYKIRGLIKIKKIEMGAALYIGWFTAVLLFLGGGLLCSSCPPSVETIHSARFRADP